MHIIFVCLGNICRSVMAERIAEKYFQTAGITVQLSSAGTSNEEAGNPMDPRAARLLQAHGYRVGDHKAHQITVAEIQNADLVLAAEPRHMRVMQSMVGHTDNLRLMTDFDPKAQPGDGIPDPWYGDEAGFQDTLEVLERIMPDLVKFVQQS